ncbi:patatin-like phospholipase family protein [Tepidiforma sp.]|uniref:patatin-like phospholipase family protein n=1 Tax=Tepidiforma sp. TaxID=2682230 RepID=UPI00261D6759|nr:patatin-like phospholipase family protein [Tepidiforma sp.]MCX7618954.1 patatin-like phospholipase family protein [Tepidiforma sp.]
MTAQGPRQGRLALVLGGGGTLGVVQAAYIQAAFELGFRPDIVIGTSVGALNGAWVAMYPDDPQGLLDVWRGLGRIRVLRWNPLHLAARVTRNPRALRDNDIVRGLIDAHVRDLRFEDARLELAVVATNLTRGRKHLFREGPLAPAIAASTAIPGVFEPVELAGELYVDGCITASVDIASALALGATEVLAIDLTPPAGAAAPPKTALGVLAQSFRILSRATTEAMEAIGRSAAAVQVVRPDLAGLSPWRLDVAEPLIQEQLAQARCRLTRVLDPWGRVAGGGNRETGGGKREAGDGNRETGGGNRETGERRHAA